MTKGEVVRKAIVKISTLAVALTLTACGGSSTPSYPASFKQSFVSGCTSSGSASMAQCNCVLAHLESSGDSTANLTREEKAGTLRSDPKAKAALTACKVI